VPKTWILTGSLDNFRATREHGFRVIGAKERRRALADQIEPGDRIVLYVTGVQAFGGIVEVTGDMYEDRALIWPAFQGQLRAAVPAAA
jgi:predicted RNA-binding protein